MIALCFDLYYNYFRYIIYEDVKEEIKDGAAFASAASTAAQLIALTILLLWGTQSIINLTNLMGERLKGEAKFLRLIMWIFSLSYVGIACFYFYQLVIGMPCRQLYQCNTFSSIMQLMTLALLWDFLPNAALYYCHFKVTSISEDQAKIGEHQSPRIK